MSLTPSSQQLTISKVVASGATEFVGVVLPAQAIVSLKGYGYTYIPGTSYQLTTTLLSFPERSDQEGSLLQPQFFDAPIPCKQSGQVGVFIKNNTGRTQTYLVKLNLLTTHIIESASTGGALFTDITVNQFPLASVTRTGSFTESFFLPQSYTEFVNTNPYQQTFASTGTRTIVWDFGNVRAFSGALFSLSMDAASNSTMTIDVSTDGASYTNLYTSLPYTTFQRLGIQLNNFSAQFIRISWNIVSSGNAFYNNLQAYTYY